MRDLGDWDKILSRVLQSNDNGQNAKLLGINEV